MRTVCLAVVGGGGKTSALACLAGQVTERRVLLTTTTHIYPFVRSRVCLVDPTPEEMGEALAVPGVVCAGSRAEQKKLGPLPPQVLSAAKKRAELVLYEGDGSRGLPLKLHQETEPVILPGTDCCLVVAGLSALGRPVREAVHRYEREPLWRQAPETPVGPGEVVRCLLETVEATGLPREKIKVFLNQADVLEDLAPALEIQKDLLARGLDCRVGSLRNPPSFFLSWLL